MRAGESLVMVVVVVVGSGDAVKYLVGECC
jgi:hypothetical protein